MYKQSTAYLPMLLLIAFSALHCRRDQKATLPDDTGPFADFPEFYERFHADSAFQMTHIQWPLQGGTTEPDSNPTGWQPENWTLHRPVDCSQSDFNRQFTPVGDDILVEHITHEMGDYGMTRRWARLGQDWFLIYYAEQNRSVTPKSGVEIEGGFLPQQPER